MPQVIEKALGRKRRGGNLTFAGGRKLPRKNSLPKKKRGKERNPPVIFPKESVFSERALSYRGGGRRGGGKGSSLDDFVKVDFELLWGLKRSRTSCI